MLLITLFLHVLTFFAIASAYTIPVRRIRIPTHETGSGNHRSTLMKKHFKRALLSLSNSGSSASKADTSTITSSQIPHSTLENRATSRKYVVAHHMVGNTFPYELQDWADDVALAHASGIDGFALNMGRDEWQPDRVSDAYTAAQQSGLDFKLFLSLDMTSFPCASATDAQTLRDLVLAHISHPNQLQYDSRAFVSSFAGETCTFGQGSAPDGWKNEFTKHPDLAGKIYFVPSFFIDPAKFGDFRDVMDGDFNWNSGWPIQVTTDFAKQIIASKGQNLVASLASITSEVSTSRIQSVLSQFIGSTDTDKQHLEQLSALGGGVTRRDGNSKPAYMAAVSPWFFTHYSPETFNKNFVFLSDQHLYSRRWESLIAARDQFDIVQVLTWNDYGESHYIGPIKGAQPNSQAWVDGMDHTAWLELTRYYATAFREGNAPTVDKDKIFMWSRPHPTQATAPDPVGQPKNFELFEDTVWAVVMTTAPSNVVLSTSPSKSQTFSVPAGLTKLSIPITAGGTMKGTIERDGKALVTLNPSDFQFQANPKTYNFNAFVASATAN
ncbi:Glucan endo-1,3-alpha-glucosidase agn1 [Hypsizygus marmoreus]|uniref:Glucan endo-1,3-alpha-glucosidase agn1 n=1 Tax=Hypsizygus marmoreus TaxID=39966 RepID=A0A369JEL2_HYPMA|nr:Glucan endo-1,3-alpha-glucosidase agn1 [Hypsizygus marmoreus]